MCLFSPYISTFLHSAEWEEEKERNGIKKKELREKREKKKAERMVEEEKIESDAYEETDDDEDFKPPPSRVSYFMSSEECRYDSIITAAQKLAHPAFVICKAR